MALPDNELTVDFNHLMTNGLTAEAQRTQRFRREKGEKKEERRISLFLFFLILTLRDLCVLCASAVKDTIEIINSNNSYEIRSA
ncbi:MAG TPA: hypothetical protein VJ810_01275 [Blastocatellia bacterium]|nr:hypothetical protein [Blastocatellia bacterium]